MCRPRMGLGKRTAAVGRIDCMLSLPGCPVGSDGFEGARNDTMIRLQSTYHAHRSSGVSAPLLAALLGASLLVASAAPIAAAASPWQLLEGLREGLRTDGPVAARFVQTYIPAGFEQGDEEQGHLSLWLPSCLRWSYDEGRSFLVCDGEVHQWNEEEPAGRVFAIDPAEEAGLDLLLLEVSTLQERYVANSEQAENASVIDLSMPPGQGSYHARITLDSTGSRVTGFEYVDDEGNRTRFTIADYKSLGHTALFRPPVGLEWARE